VTTAVTTVTSGSRGLRGGDFTDFFNIASLFVANRNGYDPSTRNSAYGFRCARSP
jgi:formylglycine-generating enzyme required for sulfatase activity